MRGHHVATNWVLNFFYFCYMVVNSKTYVLYSSFQLSAVSAIVSYYYGQSKGRNLLIKSKFKAILHMANKKSGKTCASKSRRGLFLVLSLINIWEGGACFSSQSPGVVEQLTIESRKTQTKVIALANHKGRGGIHCPIKTRSNYTITISPRCFWFYFWLVKKMARLFFSQSWTKVNANCFRRSSENRSWKGGFNVKQYYQVLMSFESLGWF